MIYVNVDFSSCPVRFWKVSLILAMWVLKIKIWIKTALLRHMRTFRSNQSHLLIYWTNSLCSQPTFAWNSLFNRSQLPFCWPSVAPRRWRERRTALIDGRGVCGHDATTSSCCCAGASVLQLLPENNRVCAPREFCAACCFKTIMWVVARIESTMIHCHKASAHFILKFILYSAWFSTQLVLYPDSVNP